MFGLTHPPPAQFSRTWRDPGAPTDSFYRVRPECTDVPKTRFRNKAEKTLSARKWRAAFTSEGYLDIRKTLSRIHRGGIHPSIRGEVWEFLLICYDPKSTFEEREHIRQLRSLELALSRLHVAHAGEITSSPQHALRLLALDAPVLGCSHRGPSPCSAHIGGFLKVVEPLTLDLFLATL
ncbi:hypothetical protein K7X08_012519 [Anisodus acutangulus]|uniref:Rab-GAP TBC domain-containing protein n=1 Tax=Anisodus acutangulus TaxID=402998 RepID=A0A9Q1QX56_9SOLA|nr:hypothetical protein K7X08_012519 [Anisodus acutangulus]